MERKYLCFFGYYILRLWITHYGFKEIDSQCSGKGLTRWKTKTKRNRDERLVCTLSLGFDQPNDNHLLVRRINFGQSMVTMGSDHRIWCKVKRSLQEKKRHIIPQIPLISSVCEYSSKQMRKTANKSNTLSIGEFIIWYYGRFFSHQELIVAKMPTAEFFHEFYGWASRPLSQF